MRQHLSACRRVLTTIPCHNTFSCRRIRLDGVDHSYPLNSPKVAFDVLLERTRSGCGTSAGIALLPSRHFRSASARQIMHAPLVIFDISARVHFLNHEMPVLHSMKWWAATNKPICYNRPNRASTVSNTSSNSVPHRMM